MNMFHSNVNGRKVRVKLLYIFTQRAVSQPADGDFYPFGLMATQSSFTYFGLKHIWGNI